MAFKPLTCPNCGGKITNFDETMKKGFCPYCDSVIVDVQRRQQAFVTNSLGAVKVAPTDFEIVGGRLLAYRGEACDVTVPDGVSVIGRGAFTGQVGITSVRLPEGLEEIEDGVTGTERLGPSYYLGHTIMHGAFSGCVRLRKVSLPTTLRKIGASTFAGCNELESMVFPESLKSIGFGAFAGCGNLSSARFEEGVTIGSCAFSGCGNLSSVRFAENNTVGGGAFTHCDLTTVTIPKGFQTQSEHAIPFDVRPEGSLFAEERDCSKLASRNPSKVRKIVFSARSDRDRLMNVTGEEAFDDVMHQVERFRAELMKKRKEMGFFGGTYYEKQMIKEKLRLSESVMNELASLFPTVIVSDEVD